MTEPVDGSDEIALVGYPYADASSFHREVADRIIEVWRAREQRITAGLERKRPEHLITVAQMTQQVSRVYTGLVGRPAGIKEPIALWVVTVGDLGGVARHVLDTVRTGIPGWRISVLCPEGLLAERLRELGAAVITDLISPKDPLPAALGAVRHTIRSLRPAIVHSHLAYSDFLTAGAVTGLQRRLRPKLVTTEHGISGNDLVYHGTRSKSHIMEIAHATRLRRFDALIAVSAATLQAVRNKWHPPRRLKTIVIPNGVDAPAEVPRPQPGRFHIVSLTRLAPEKNLPDLIAAFKLVHEAYSVARLTIAGDGPLRGSLEATISANGLQDSVSLPGHVNASDLLAEADVLAQLSTWENCSYALLDGVCGSLSVVATSTGGTPGVVGAPNDYSSPNTGTTRLPSSPDDIHVNGALPDSLVENPDDSHFKSETVVLSVVIPTYNGERTILDQLNALAHQSFDQPWELIISDNGCTDGTIAIVKNFARTAPMPMRIVDATGKKGVSHARNMGVKAARGQYFAICDCDDIVTPGWLAAAYSGMHMYDFVTGTARLFSKNIRDVTEVWGGSPVPSIESIDLLGGNFGGSKSFYLAIGGMNESFSIWGGEDTEFSIRVALAGANVGYVPDMAIYYRQPTTLFAKAVKWYQGGRNVVTIWRSYPEYYAHRLGVARAIKQLFKIPIAWTVGNGFVSAVEHVASTFGTLIEQLTQLYLSTNNGFTVKRELFIGILGTEVNALADALGQTGQSGPPVERFIIGSSQTLPVGSTDVALRRIKGTIGPDVGLVRTLRTIQMAIRAVQPQTIYAMDPYTARMLKIICRKKVLKRL